MRIASRTPAGSGTIALTWIASAAVVLTVVGGLRLAARPIATGALPPPPAPVPATTAAPAPAEGDADEQPAAAPEAPVQWWEYRDGRDVIVVEGYDQVPAAFQHTAKRVR